MRSKRRGRWREMSCWTEPRRVDFPAPIGRHRTYLYEVPALDLFSRTYGVQTATFRMGLQLGLFNRGLGFLGWLRRIGRLKRPTRYTGLLYTLARRFKKLGDASFAIQVQVVGSYNDEEIEHSVTLIEAESEGLGVCNSILITMVKHWVENGVDRSGAFPSLGYVGLDDIKPELIEHKVKLVRS